MSNLEPRIEAVREKYGLRSDDFWQIKQNKQWVCKHAALEIVAVKAGVEWMPPQIIEANAPALVTSMVVTGKMGDRVEWATGETNATNYSVSGKQPAYPWAMAEKRAKDRVVLKLVGIHGLVYSEDEAEDFKTRPPDAVPDAPAPSIPPKPPIYDRLVADMRLCKLPEDVSRWWNDPECEAHCNKMPEYWVAELKKDVIAHRKALAAAKEAKATRVEKDIADTFPGSRIVNETHRELSVLEAG